MYGFWSESLHGLVSELCHHVVGFSGLVSESSPCYWIQWPSEFHPHVPLVL